MTGKEVLLVRAQRVYFRGGFYTDQVAAGAAAARLHAERLFPELGASVKTESNDVGGAAAAGSTSPLRGGIKSTNGKRLPARQRTSRRTGSGRDFLLSRKSQH